MLNNKKGSNSVDPGQTRSTQNGRGGDQSCCGLWTVILISHLIGQRTDQLVLFSIFWFSSYFFSIYTLALLPYIILPPKHLNNTQIHHAYAKNHPKTLVSAYYTKWDKSARNHHKTLVTTYQSCCEF